MKKLWDAYLIATLKIVFSIKKSLQIRMLYSFFVDFISSF